MIIPQLLLDPIESLLKLVISFNTSVHLSVIMQKLASR